MRVLLANPPWKKGQEGRERFGVRAGSRWPFTVPAASAAELPYVPFPFFLAQAAAVLEQDSPAEVLAVDAIAEGWTDAGYEERVLAYGPDVIVAETATASWDVDMRHAARMRELLPHVQVVLVGPHVSAYPAEALRECGAASFCIAGEYELPLRGLVLALSGRGEFDDVPGLARVQDGEVHVTPRPAPDELADLDALPWPAWKHFPMYRYKDYFCGIPGPMVNMLASRGCPYRCSFCVWPRVMYGSHRYRVRTPDDVAAEMGHLVETYGFKTVYFDDDTFNLGQERILALCDAMERRGVQANLALMGRADAVDEQTLRRLRDVGLIAVKYGVESGDQGVLDRCGKGLDLEAVKRGVRLTREMGIRVHLTFTVGLPGETTETMRRTRELALELAPDSLQISLATPFPGTPFYEEVKGKGYLLADDATLFDGAAGCVTRTEELTPDQIEEGFRGFQDAWKAHKEACV